MNEAVALRVLGSILQWRDEEANEEFRWLRLMSRLKYDGYRDFQAGVRFIESLATWLQQFDQDDRRVAYNFVRHRLVYVGPAEMERLVDRFYPREVFNRLRNAVAATAGTTAHEVLLSEAGEVAVAEANRKVLYFALSEGARVDLLRHSNVGRISNEQVVTTTQPDTEKWKDLLANLRSDLDDPCALFSTAFLIDDFAGTGTSFVRQKADGTWTGKLWRFRRSLEQVLEQGDEAALFEDEWRLYAHHYLATPRAVTAIELALQQSRAVFEMEGWATSIESTYGYVFPADVPLQESEPFYALTQRYYNPSIRTKATDVGGATHLGLGYGACALPLILDHNTPNNSVALLWAEAPEDAEGGFPRTRRS